MFQARRGTRGGGRVQNTRACRRLSRVLFPGAKPINIKLIFRKSDGRILGAQAVGEADVDKRIDVIATAIQFGGTVFDLEHFTDPMTACWADLGSPELGPELQKKIVDGVLEEVDGRSFEALSQERDALILGLLELLSRRGKTKPVAERGHAADDS